MKGIMIGVGLLLATSSLQAVTLVSQITGTDASTGCSKFTVATIDYTTASLKLENEIVSGFPQGSHTLFTNVLAVTNSEGATYPIPLNSNAGTPTVGVGNSIDTSGVLAAHPTYTRQATPSSGSPSHIDFDSYALQGTSQAVAFVAGTWGGSNTPLFLLFDSSGSVITSTTDTTYQTMAGTGAGALWLGSQVGTTGVYKFGFSNKISSSVEADYALDATDLAASTTASLKFQIAPGTKVYWVACTGDVTSVTLSNSNTLLTIALSVPTSMATTANHAASGLELGVIIATDRGGSPDATVKQMGKSDGSDFTVFSSGSSLGANLAVSWRDLETAANPSSTTWTGNYEGAAVHVAGTGTNSVAMKAHIPQDYIATLVSGTGTKNDIAGSFSGVATSITFNYGGTDATNYFGKTAYYYTYTYAPNPAAWSGDLQFGQGANNAIISTSLATDADALHQTYGTLTIAGAGPGSSFTGTVTVSSGATIIFKGTANDYSGATLTGAGTATCSNTCSVPPCTCSFGTIQ